jgi:hypothetical protein
MMEGNSGVTYRDKSDWPVDELMVVLAELSTGVQRLPKGEEG